MDHPKQSHYPSFDVLTEKENWDVVTQQVINNRTNPNREKYFSNEEKELLLSLLPLLFPSHLGELSIDVITLFENRCANGKVIGYPIGSKYKKLQIVHIGLENIQKQIYSQHETIFSKLSEDTQKIVIKDIQKNLGYLNIWEKVSPQLFFKTLLKELIPIVYSDPSIWSDIGYGGPAYPRGYYAFGPEQFDSWEAKRNDKKEE
ncbi:hypothetical protein CIB95_00640 [Lottiidibacillus patelloidae]|uniref:Gluconate 2-dehydrogenase n=1 Tax=Lottiidibacillus patelloidae TaxID=2670334 RepID=A0A263BWS7_9BACI|nr:gluconate 2-dehydrogenase subunit 3 family protein [Lottiidibacillus patelloidae]OZM58120.1 hypothetical protein CIB95_00640 [Lottiidibacillus patelloidae]